MPRYLADRRRAARDHHRQLRRPSAAVSRRLDRRTGGQRHGERPRGLAARAPLALVVHVRSSKPGSPTEVLEAEVRAHGARPRARAGVPIVGGDTKVVEHGKADGMYITTTGIGRVDPRASLSSAARAAGRPRAGLRDRSAITASRSCWPAATSISKPTCAPTRARCCRSSRRWSTRPAAACAGCAIRRAAAWPRAERTGARLRPAASCSTKRRCRCATRCAAPASCSGSIRCTSPTKDSSSRSSRPSCADRALAALRGAPGGEEAAIIGDDRHRSPPGPSSPSTALRRHARRRHAGRRSAAADLLSGRRMTARTMRLARPHVVAERLLARNAASRAFFAREARSARRRLPRDGAALSARRPAARVRSRRLRRPTPSTSRSSSSIRSSSASARLPALDLSAAFERWLPALVGPDDIVDGLRPARGRPRRAGGAGGRAARAARMTFALPGADGDLRARSAVADDPFMSSGADRNPVPHALGDGARLLRASRARPRRRRERVSVSVPRAARSRTPPRLIAEVAASIRAKARRRRAAARAGRRASRPTRSPTRSHAIARARRGRRQRC